jgi:phosphoglycolate phosphatase-like HAD superfamily hydrolase
VPTSRLVLWDIDHTLLQTGGVGSEVFRAAFMATTGRELENPPDPTGKLEPALFAAACAENGIPTSAELFEAFAAAQEQGYRSRAADLAERGRVLPGVRELLAALADAPGVIQTVLSGNTLRSGRAKLELFDLASWLDLSCAVGGEDGAARPELVLAAWSRVHGVRGRRFTASQTVLIGDTPADVDAALSNHCRIVAVATGKTTADELAEAGAEAVLPDLSDWRTALDVILQSDGPASGP